MEEVIIEGYKFIRVPLGGAEIVFSTAENELNFNKATEEGKKNLEKIKEWFKVKKVGFVDQVHGDTIVLYNGELKVADALITDLQDTAIGVFTADCVPILLYDKTNNIIAAVHSGWKGTLAYILSKTIDTMSEKFGTKGEELVAYIGPHNRQCCYEVGQEVIDKFKNSNIYAGIDIFEGRKLSMVNCIEHQLKLKGVKIGNIHDMNICTFCNKELKLHSYRKNKNGGRMFSFIFLID